MPGMSDGCGVGGRYQEEFIVVGAVTIDHIVEDVVLGAPFYGLHHLFRLRLEELQVTLIQPNTLANQGVARKRHIVLAGQPLYPMPQHLLPRVHHNI